MTFQWKVVGLMPAPATRFLMGVSVRGPTETELMFSPRCLFVAACLNCQTPILEPVRDIAYFPATDIEKPCYIHSYYVMFVILPITKISQAS